MCSGETTRLEKTLVGRIASRKRLEWIPRETSREVVMITCPLSARQGSEKERVLGRRVIVMEDHHIQGRRRT
jgi:hypothetical protein